MIRQSQQKVTINLQETFDKDFNINENDIFFNLVKLIIFIRY